MTNETQPAAPMPLRASVLDQSSVAAGEILTMTKTERAAYMKAWYETHKAERAAYDKAYRKAHKAEEAARAAAYYEKNKARIATRNAAYQKANKDKIAAQKAIYNMAYCQTHKAEMATCSAAWAKANPEKRAATSSTWAKANPDKRRDIQAKRRARKRGAFVEKVERAVVYARDQGRCHLCGKKVNPKHWHLEHIVPLSRGGEHSYKNVAVSHPTCNLRKNKKMRGQLRLF